MYTVGKIVKPQGIKGEVKAEIITSFPDHFLDLGELYIDIDSKLQAYPVEAVRISGRFVYIKFSDIRTRNDADLLRNKELLIPDDELMPLDKDEFYIHSIVGMDVYSENGTHLGSISDVVQNVSGDIYVIKNPDDAEILVPAVKEFILEINQDERRMVIRVIDGLLDVNEIE
jgi:16S rRNA processing protein RimM